MAIFMWVFWSILLVFYCIDQDQRVNEQDGSVEWARVVAACITVVTRLIEYIHHETPSILVYTENFIGCHREIVLL